MNQIKLTRRAIELFINADIIAKENSCNAIHPIHLFLGAFKMNYDINQELKKLVKIDEKQIVSILNSFHKQESEKMSLKIELDHEFDVTIFKITEQIIHEAQRVSELFEEHGQIFVNDGQILKAIIDCDDKIISDCLININKNLVKSIMSLPRDMIVDLSRDYQVTCTMGVEIRKASKSDEEWIKKFVLKYFYDRWANTIEIGFELNDVPIYIAIANNEIVGFAGYNISRRRQGYFGPLGVLKSYRNKKIGQALVENCMLELKNQGFATCIIGNASSFDFYEKACAAKVVQLENTN